MKNILIRINKHHNMCMNGDEDMISIEKLKEQDSELMDIWKGNYENEHNIKGVIKYDKKYWREKIMGCSNCQYWIINNGGIKIGVVDINHIDDHGCVLEYYIGDIHFRGRNITSSILWNMYNYLFHELKMKYAITVVSENDEKNLNTHLAMGCDIKGRFKENEHRNEKFNDMIYVLMNSEKWNNIKGGFDFEQISIEKI